MIKELEFSKVSKGQYEAKFISTGSASVQVDRAVSDPVEVLVNIPGMMPSLNDTFQNVSDSGIVFKVDFPVGLEITLRCGEVRTAKIMSDDE